MTQFTLPTSRRVTQDWGQDFQWLNGKHYPNGFYSSIGWKGHNGIDYGCPVGDPVESVCDGVVEYVGPGNNHPLLSGGGNTVLVRNDELGMRFEYLHLSQQNVYTGQKVKRGQVIALSGNTGTSTAPHLHVGAIPVKPNLNNGYRGRVDLTQWLYGPSNPDYAGIAAQGTITQEEEDMPLTDEDAAKIAGHVWNFDYKTADGRAGKPLWLLQSMDAIIREAVEKTAAATAQVILSTEIPNVLTGGKTSLGLETSWDAYNVQALKDDAKPAGVSDAEFSAALQAGIEKAVAGLSITLTAEGNK